MSRYLLNPELPVVKPGFKGNFFTNGRFEAGEGATVDASYRKVLRWQLSSNPQKEEKKNDTFKLKAVRGRAFLQGEDDVLVWLGHASFFIRINGIHIITDPCLRDLPFVKRQVELPCSIKELIGIDYLLASHGHRDHFDMATVHQLIEQNPGMEMLLPLKVSELLGKKRKQVRYQEAGWWQQFRVDGLEIFFLPARHWNRRWLLDYNKNLWGSFLIKTEKLSIYFAGDSGYAPHFKEINKITGAPDICLLPIGAYKPGFIMQEAHLDPKEAVEAFHDLKGNTMIPMHYGTYDLSNEPMGEPVKILKGIEQQKKIQGKLRFLDVGEEFKL